MKRSKPPFRADHVGSLLRPAALKAAREKRAKGEIGAAGLKALEDREIERVIKKQEEVGLQGVTDGSFAAPGGTSIFSGGSMASSAMSWIPALPLPASPRATRE